MAREYISHWRCNFCHGTGKQIRLGRVIRCVECDGTGNAMVDGRAAEHRREIEAIEANERESGAP